MRISAILLAVAFTLSATSIASAAKMKASTADAGVTAQNQSNSFLGDALHPWAPSTPEPKMKKTKSKKMIEEIKPLIKIKAA